MKIPTLAMVGTATLAAAIACAPSARAETLNFQSPSGNIYCTLDSLGAACDIRQYTYQPPPPPECGQHLAWGSRFTLAAGKAGAITCHGDTLQVPGEQTLNYGQTISAGTITCDSEMSGMKCTDSSTGHFFRVSMDSFQLG